MYRIGWKSMVVGSFVAILVLVAVYFAGFRQGTAELEAQRRDFERKLSEAQKSLAQSESRNAYVVARLALYRSALDLEHRNFGLAGSHLREAAGALASISPGLAGVDKAGLDQIRRDVAGVNLGVADDVEKEKNQILEIASRLDGLVRPPPAG